MFQIIIIIVIACLLFGFIGMLIEFVGELFSFLGELLAGLLGIICSPIYFMYIAIKNYTSYVLISAILILLGTIFSYNYGIIVKLLTYTIIGLLIFKLFKFKIKMDIKKHEHIRKKNRIKIINTLSKTGYIDEIKLAELTSLNSDQLKKELNFLIPLGEIVTLETGGNLILFNINKDKYTSSSHNFESQEINLD